MPVIADARNRRSLHILDSVTRFIQYREKARAGRTRLRPRERMHFHENCAGSPSLISQDCPRTLEYLLFETLDVDLDQVDSPPGKRGVERHHRHRDDAVASVLTRLDSRLLPARRGKADLADALTDGGPDHGYSVFPAVDADVGFQSRHALGIGFERSDVARSSDPSRERQRVQSHARADFRHVIAGPHFAHHTAPNFRLIFFRDKPARLRAQPESVSAIDHSLEPAASRHCSQHAIVSWTDPIP